MCRLTPIENGEKVICFFAGVIVGLAGLVFGDSYIPGLLLEKTTGIGWDLLVWVGVAIFLLIYFQWKRRPPVRWTREIISKATRVCVQASFVLFGVVSFSFYYWDCSNSQTALGVTLHGILLAVAFVYIGWGLRSWFETLNEQYEQ